MATDYKAELERRRQRGRESQNAFRKRQAQKRRRLVEENDKLKNAIRAIAQESRTNDRPALRRHILDAMRIVELDGDESSASTGTTTTDNVAENNNHGEGLPTSESMPGDLLVCPIFRDPYHLSGLGDSWTESLAMFIGHGALTFSGCLFWHMVAKLEERDARERDMSITDSNARCQSLPTLPIQVLAFHCDRDASSSVLPKHYRDRLESDRDQWQKSWMPVIEERLRTILCLKTPVASSPTDLSTYPAISICWLSPVSIEHRLRSAVGDNVFSAMAAPMIRRWEEEVGRIGYISSSAQIQAAQVEGPPKMLDDFFDALADTYVCFGVGMRWTSTTFDKTLKNWCTSVLCQISES